MRPKRREGKRIGRIVLMAFTIAHLVAGCSRQVAPPTEVVRPVKTMVVTAGEESRTRSFPGIVEASKRVELAFQAPGLLVKFPAREGQRVAEGEAIGELRQDEFQARLTALQGQLDQARAALSALRAGERREERLRREAQVRAAAARLANARAELDRALRLVQNRTISRAEYDLTETAFRVAEEEHQAAVQLQEKGTIGREEDIQAKEAEVRGLEGRVVEAKIQLDDCILRAPYSGVIAQRFVEEGQNVQAKQRVVRFQDVDEIEIAVDVPETVMAADILPAEIVQMVAEISGAPGVQFPVHIREVAQVADPTTQTFKVRVAMQAPPGIRVLPGMTATVTVDYRRSSVLGNRVLVPISAISKQETGEQVAWVIGSDQLAIRGALARPLPYALALMVLIVVTLFNSIRATLLVWLIVPLAIIGVTVGLLLTGQPFGFMALLGVLSLGGEQIKNSIVVLSKIRIEVEQGATPHEAILNGCVSKVRPVLMVAVTTVLGSIPLLADPFFGTMAVCIMFGLSFACVLTMIVMPALYAILFRVDEQD